MADDTNFRSYRPADQRWPAQAAPPAGSREGGNDPLAELARLIGQTDPFADMPPRPTAAARPAPATMPPQPAPGDPYSAKPFESHGGFAEPRQDSFQPAYDPAIYGTPPEQQPQSHPSQAYYDDPSRIPQGDEHFEAEFSEERPRRGMKVVMVLAALALIGTGAAFGYRAFYGSGSTMPPPVIKANSSPSKIVPAPSGDSSNKMIYDRVGDVSQGEKVVAREEKPVEVKDTSRSPARVVFPGMPTTSAPQDSTTMAMTSPPLSAEPVGPASAEPKKIRTVTIRPDQAGATAAAAPRPNATPARNAAAAPVAASSQPAPAPAPIMAAPPSAPSAQQRNAPLSLNPQAANAEASARPAFPPPPAPTAAPAAPTRMAAVPPAAQAAAGAYTVQISSQRSENDAQASFRSLQAKFPSLLRDRQPIIRRADLGDKGIYFRAMVGPFASADQATQFCGSLKSAGGQCVVQRN
jgi:hypothetical protein